MSLVSGIIHKGCQRNIFAFVMCNVAMCFLCLLKFMIVNTSRGNIPYIWLFCLCEILALLGQNGGKKIMAHINFGSPRV